MRSTRRALRPLSSVEPASRAKPAGLHRVVAYQSPLSSWYATTCSTGQTCLCSWPNTNAAAALLGCPFKGGYPFDLAPTKAAINVYRIIACLRKACALVVSKSDHSLAERKVSVGCPMPSSPVEFVAHLATRPAHCVWFYHASPFVRALCGPGQRSRSGSLCVSVPVGSGPGSSRTCM